MKISGFTIVKNAVQFNYPVRESILSILPICDEFVVNVGDSSDQTLELIKSIKSPKIKIFQRKWDHSLGKEMLSIETNHALAKCEGDWCFYLQSDEVVHQRDLKTIRKYMQKYYKDKDVEGFKFRWLHFYGSYWRYRVDPPWYQKQVRIIRNQKNIKSEGDAWGFQKTDSTDFKTVRIRPFVYHYGWVNNPQIMSRRRKNASELGFAELGENEKKLDYDYGNLNRFPIYFGTHPKVMRERVNSHILSRLDWQKIKSKYFWSPFLWFRPRYKTFLRPKKSIPR
ncbi:MAG: glycosyltransferase [Candidatus Omnitrophica bacterium]|nr:glycosyltransferase [Candidatus Omnitrophota bacterium]